MFLRILANGGGPVLLVGIVASIVIFHLNRVRR